MKRMFGIRKQFIALVLIIILGVTLYPTIKAIADNQLIGNRTVLSTNSTVKNSDSINILEIQPGDSFTLTPNNRTGTYSDTILGNNVIVQNMTMSEFIGNVNQLNGLYDVIIIGNKIVNSIGYSQINTSVNETNPNQGSWGLKPSQYNENDITKRKADEVVEFINSGQLVYVNKSIFSDNNLNNSNLVTKFKAIDKDNYKKKDSEDGFKLEDIVNDYNSNVKKRFKIGVVCNGGDIIANGSNEGGKIESRKLDYNITFPESIGAVNIKLYLDMNGDGVFREKEIYKTLAIDNPEEEASLKYELGHDFIGELSWKIEVEPIGGDNKVKIYKTGLLNFKYVEGSEEKVIKVLQVLPQNTNLNLKENNKFNEICGLQNDYEIVVETIEYAKFNSDILSGSLKLNGNYNMVILGFQDEYGKFAQINMNGVNELKSFIASGQSVMFTHDSMPGYPLGSNVTSNLLDNFRNYVGQARFLPIGSETVNVPSTSNPNNYVYVADLYKSFDFTSNTYKIRNIPNISIVNKDLKGYSFWSRKGNTNNERQNEIFQINEGLITSYPFKLTNESMRTMNVAPTHHQYFQLNLEDPDVVPWYNLTNKNVNSTTYDAGVNKYDPRNYYYTYSKGNITYSGTGHTSGYTDEEYKLFVNTIVKAERGANHRPVIQSEIIKSKEKEYDKEVPYDSDYRFTATATDLDNDDVDVKVTVEGKEIREVSNVRIKQGDPIDIIVSKDLYKEVNDIITIKIEAQDILEAKAETKIYKIRPTREPMVNPEIEGGRGLVGEVIPITINLEKYYETSDKKITNVSLSRIEDYSTELLTVENPNEVNFNDNIINSHTYNVITNAELTGLNLNVKLKYTLQGREIVKDLSIPVYSKKGQIVAKVQNENGEIFNFNTLATLKSANGLNDSIGIEASNGGLYSWSKDNNKLITKSNYTLALSGLQNGYEVIAYNINNAEEILDRAITSDILINYENPKVEVIFKVGKIQHGLYKGTQGNDILVQEGGITLATGSVANIAASFCINSNSSSILLNVDDKLSLSLNNIAVYKLENGAQSLINTTITNDGNNYNIKVNDSINKFTNIIIRYSCKIPANRVANKQAEYTNTIVINDIRRKAFNFRSSLNSLPDLF